MDDWLLTLDIVARETKVKEKLLKGKKVGNKTFEVPLDGYNQLPYLTGKVKESPRKEFFYFNDDGQYSRDFCYESWKIVFMEQRTKGTLGLWADPFTPLRTPKAI